ncbi:hypothetical protein [Alteromonas mediterranea]|uniref:hypothetical protein n=1 Tax=Alteromonas mediterranea TaxID=314275 RepID=UPI002FE1FC30
MDILKTLINAVPSSSIIVKVIFFIIGLALLAWYTFVYVPDSQKKITQSNERIEAISWYLGWNTMSVLLPNWSKASQVLPSMDAYLEVLEIKLENPSSHYLTNPSSDSGSRVQKYREEVYSRLMAKHSKSIANYYGVPGNLLQTIASNQHGTVSDIERSKIQAIVNEIKLPDDLKDVPSRNLLDWANRINSYYEAKL